MRRWVVVLYRRFGTAYHPIFDGQEGPTRKPEITQMYESHKVNEEIGWRVKIRKKLLPAELKRAFPLLQMIVYTFNC